MNQTWIYRPKTSALVSRAARFPLNNAAELVIKFEAWNLVWNLSCQNISQTGILCKIDFNSDFSTEDANDLLKILEVEPEAKLYLHGITSAHKPIEIYTQWSRFAFTANGIDLAFSIISTPDERLYHFYTKKDETVDHGLK